MSFPVSLAYRKIRIILITSFSLLLAVSLFSLTEETASLRDFLYGSTDDTAYDNFYSHIVKGLAVPDYNQHAPWEQQNNNFGYFRIATSNELSQWGNVVLSFLQENFEEAETLIETYQFPYEIVRFNDTDTDRTYYMLREKLNMEYFCDNGYPENEELHQIGSFDYGWGLYIYNPDSEIPIVITTPHPKDDFITVPISGLAFQEWDARYLMIAGAGRERRWTRVGAYTNGKSLSDPTRAEDHVFNVFYKAACSDIRSTFGRRELSMQMHSFDHTHMGYANLQISAGNSAQNYPSLPIRDLSGNYHDIVNASPYVIFPDDTIGRHQEVLVTDYYSVHYRTHGFNYDNEGELIEISNNINLPGFGNNRQVAHTLRHWNRFDVSSPFFHIEMEELPSCYEQNRETYWWFYGYDEETELWDAENHFSNAIQFYTPWLEHVSTVLPDVLELDDGEPPSDPANLEITSVSYNRTGLSWERSFAYDFFTYEILFATQPIDLEEPNFGVINRNRISTLAAQAFNTATATTLQPGLNYYLRIRAKDYNDRYSDVSNEIMVSTIPADVVSIDAFGRDNSVDVQWFVQSQRNNHGFSLWRLDVEEDALELLDSYENNPALAGVNADSVWYVYRDDTAENSVLYEYKVSSFGFSEEDYLHRLDDRAQAEPIYYLVFRNEDGTVVDSIEFGMNRFTEDGFDIKYDLFKGQEPDDDTEDDFIYSMFYHPLEWVVPTIELQRDINGLFNPDENYKIWRLRARSNLIDEPVSISVSQNYTRHGEKLYLNCLTTGEMYDLAEGAADMQFADEEYRYWTLYWGNLLPVVDISSQETRFFQAGEEVLFEWDTEYKALAQSLDLFLSSKSDSLLLAAGIDTRATDFHWNVPDSLYLYGTEFVVRANLSEDSYIDYKSDFRIGVVPAGHRFTSPKGWHLLTNPFEDRAFSLSDIFGDDALIYAPYLNQPDSLRFFEFGKVYWVHHPHDLDYELNGTVRKNKYEIPLLKGWNLVPNVFMQNLSADALTISRRYPFGWIDLSFKDAVSERLIESALFTFRDSKYTIIDTLRIGDAFWLYSHHDNLKVIFNPFIDYPEIQKQEPKWKAHITLNHTDTLADDIIIGAPFGFYALKPPPRPGQKLNFYINEFAPPNDYLHAYFKADLNKQEGIIRNWNFVIEIDSPLYPLTFKLDGHNFPEDYDLFIMIGDEFSSLVYNDDFVYYPTSRKINGSVQVRFVDHSSVEIAPEVPVLYANYPNPFSAALPGYRTGGTNISFWVDKLSAVKIDIFNIRGQKVITLIDDELDSGNYDILWNGYGNDGKPAASGIYFYRLNVAGKDIANKKMLMLK